MPSLRLTVASALPASLLCILGSALSCPCAFASGDLVGSRSWGTLIAPNANDLRVQRVALELDFRRQHRGTSKAEYLVTSLSSTEAWDGDLVFASTAKLDSVEVDGKQASLKSVPVDGLAKDCTLSASMMESFPAADRASAFHVNLSPHQVRRILVRFAAAPLHQRIVVHTEDTADGLARHKPGDERFIGGFTVNPIVASKVSLRDFFEYPVLPACGFGAGVGPIRIAVLTDADAKPVLGRVSTVCYAWQEEPISEHEAWFRVELPCLVWGTQAAPEEDHWVGSDGVRCVSRTTTSREEPYVRFEYSEPGFTWPFGASLFAGAQIASSNEPIVGFHLAGTLDWMIARVGTIMLGGETSFARSASVSVGYQRGGSGDWASFYGGVSTLMTFAPSATPGIEARAGGRFFFVPLDVAVQLHPWADGRHVAPLRFIAGLRVAVW
jgi:hypothetical protein